MTIQLDCYYSLSSPWAYFAGPQLQDIVRRHKVKLVLKPYDFQAVVPKTGGIPIRTRPEPRRTYHDEELARWVEWFTKLFEPLLMALIGVIIGGIVVLMYLPIFELAGSLQ